MRKLLEMYSIGDDLTAIANMSKETFKEKVKKAVRDQAISELLKENSTKTRTKNITFNNKLETQEYIKQMSPSEAKIIFKCRSRTLNIKEHMKYKFSDTSCRWCGVAEETLEHVTNCGKSEPINDIDKILTKMDLKDLKEVASRVKEFLANVEV